MVHPSEDGHTSDTLNDTIPLSEPIEGVDIRGGKNLANILKTMVQECGDIIFIGGREYWAEPTAQETFSVPRISE